MPEGLFSVVALLALGFILLFLEIFVPGGVLGIVGVLLMAYACYLAFGLSAAWGTAAVFLSVAVAVLAVRLVARSRLGRQLVLDDAGARDWKATEETLEDLLGREGRTLTPLRPAGLAEIDERRVDVVADSEFLDAGIDVRVCEVEGNRVVVEAMEDASLTDAAPPADAASLAAPDRDSVPESSTDGINENNS